MKRIIFLTGMLLPLLGYCQSSDTTIHKKFLTTSPRLGGINVTDMVAPVESNGNSFTIQQAVADIGIPLYKNFKSAHPVFIKSGIRYEGLFLSGDESISSNSFHSLTVPLLASYSFSRTASISFIGLATVGSDFKSNIQANDILYTAGVRIGFRPGNSFRYGITLTYISNYSGKFLLPIPDIDWTISKRLSLTAVLPARGSLMYKLSDAQSLGVTVGLGGSMYRLNDGDQQQYLHFRQNSAGLRYECKLGEKWKLNLVAGHTFLQRLETFNMDQTVPFDGFTKLNDRVANISYQQNSFMFQGGLSYEF